MKTKLILPYVLIFYVNIFSQFGPQRIISTDTYGAFKAIPCDVNSDGFIDVVSGSYSEGKIVWYQNLDGEGNFGPEIIIANDITTIEDLYLYDLDNDNDNDIIYKTLHLDKIAWIENMDGQGNFGPEKLIANQNYPYTISIADIDGDGDNDVFANLYHNSLFNRLVWYENTDGQGTFSNEILIEIGDFYVSILLNFDLDNDDDLDLITSYESFNPSTIIWYENLDGLGGFSQSQEIHQFSSRSGWISILQMTHSDVNADGQEDILIETYVDHPPDDNIYWLQNLNAQGNFSNPQHIHTNETTLGSLRTYDLDNDLDQDVLVSFYYGSETKIAWFENMDGQGAFGPEIIISTEVDKARDATAADINNSGFSDVISASSGDSIIAWYENLGQIGIAENKFEVFSIYPNPTENILNIQSEKNIDKVELYNNLGQLIFAVSDKKEIDISSLQNGIYFFKIVDEYGDTGVKKVIKL